MSLPSPLVLVDLETTGANPVRDRITEIAIIRVEHGEVVARWQSLVNPQIPIPPLIKRLIGITDEMVADAPTFAELADPVRALLAEATFVAHNARFDYGFLCNEYARLNQHFETAVLCTVKLSRALYPQHHRHGLDALIARHGFVCDARHRAMGDAEVVWQFIRQAVTEFDEETLAQAGKRAMKQAPRPPALPEGVLEGLPDAPGIYQLYGEGAAPLLTGRASSLRAHLMALAAAQGTKKKTAQLVKQIRRIDWQETAGELDALLREQRFVNSPPTTAGADSDNASGRVFALKLMAGRPQAPIFEQIALNDTDPAEWQEVFGMFRSRKEVDNLLREFANLYQLCPRRLGLEGGSRGACSACKQKRCAGVCAGRESLEAHDRRLSGALAALRLKNWPWQEAVVVHERSADGAHQAFHLFDRWCHLGSVADLEALHALSASLPPRRFNADIYRLLQRWLATAANQALVQPLKSFSVSPAA